MAIIDHTLLPCNTDTLKYSCISPYMHGLSSRQLMIKYKENYSLSEP